MLISSDDDMRIVSPPPHHVTTRKYPVKPAPYYSPIMGPGQIIFYMKMEAVDKNLMPESVKQ